MGKSSLHGVHMTEPSNLPPVDEYPGYFAKKPPFHRRRRVQVVGAGMAGLLLGLAISGGSGSAAPSSEPEGVPEAEVQARITAAIEGAREEAQAEAESAQAASESTTTEELEDVRLDLAATEQELRDARREIRAVKKAAKRAKRKAVAAAVKRTKAEMRDNTQAQPGTTSANSGSGSTDPRFSYCYEANDAGYGNYQRGVDPEYDWYRDSDSDGWVCEF
jgi:hypothetical protein